MALLPLGGAFKADGDDGDDNDDSEMKSLLKDMAQRLASLEGKMIGEFTTEDLIQIQQRFSSSSSPPHLSSIECPLYVSTQSTGYLFI